MEPRDGILRAAQDVFARHGFRQTSMAMIAEEADLSRQALYHHFASKEALFAALVDALHETALGEVRQAAARPSASITAALSAVCHAHHQSLMTRLAGSPFTAELIEESSRQCGPAVAVFLKRYESELEAVVTRFVRAGDFTLRSGMRARDLVQMVQIAAKGLKAIHNNGAGAGYAPALDRMIDVICSGAAAQKGATARRKTTQTGKARRVAR